MVADRYPRLGMYEVKLFLPGPDGAPTPAARFEFTDPVMPLVLRQRMLAAVQAEVERAEAEGLLAPSPMSDPADYTGPQLVR